MIQHYSKRGPAGADPAVVNRLAQYAAALHQAAVYAHVALDLPGELENPLDALWRDLIGEASDAAGEVRALRDVISWAYSHSQSFYGRQTKSVDHYGQELTPKMPSGGWSGRWDDEDDWKSSRSSPRCCRRCWPTWATRLRRSWPDGGSAAGC